MPDARRLPLPAAFVGGISLGLVAALAWTSQAAGQGTEPAPTPDRASLEQLLADRDVTPTGKTRSFDLTVKEADWELLPGVVTRP